MEAKTYIEKELKGFKGFLYATIVIAFLVDLFVIVSLGVSGMPGEYYAVPIIMLGLDVVFFVISLTSNFRFRYSVFYTAFYAISVIVLWVVYLFQVYVFNDAKFITYMALAAFIAVHNLSAVSVVFSALGAAKVGNGLKVAAIAFMAVFAAFSVFYSYFIFKDGFSGQGFTERTVNYSYNAETDTYEAVGYAGTNGTYANIADSFNGKKVSKIDCSLFCDTVTDITINASDFEFSNLDALNSMNVNLKVKVSKDSVDVVKSELYNAAIGDGYNESIINLANVFEPTTDGVFVSFVYSKESLEILTKAGEKPLDTWCGKAGDVFNLNDYANGYILHSDVNNEEDLYWCYKNFNKKILVASKSGDLQVNENEKISIEFDNVYKINFGEGNDSVYSLPSNVVNLSIGASGMEGRYVTLSTADKFFNSIPNREGFTVRYKVDGKYIENLSGVLKDESELTISPEWKLNNPIISSISTDKTSYCYGDDVEFLAVATAPLNGMTLGYSWKFSGSLESSEAAFTKYNVKPLQSGEYTLTVTASGSNTSLTSEITEKISVKIDKKKMSFDWTMPESLVYSGTEKVISCNYRSSDAINGDLIEFTTDIAYTINAGNYTFTAELTGDCVNLYYADSETSVMSFVISPYQTATVWSGSEFTYNGLAQTPSASFSGIGGDEHSVMAINVVAPDSINAGRYTATATSGNDNYVLTDNVCDYTISPKTLNVTTWINTELTYNGYNQIPGVEFDGIVGDDEVLAIIDGEQTEAGDGYTATLKGVSNNNYKVTGEPATTFNVKPLAKVVVWENLAFTYDNTEKLPSAYFINVFGVRENLAVTPSGDNKNAGTFNAVAASDNTNYELSNLSVENVTINAAALTVAWENTTLTYNGSAQKPTAVLSGVMSGDSVEVTVNVVGDGINVGSYTATASIENTNYNLSASETQFEISAKVVDVIWSGLSVVYNGTAQLPSAKYIGVSSAEIDLAVTASGDCINAGSYTLSVSGTDDNYSLNGVNAELNVSPAELELSWSGGNRGDYKFVYCGSVPGVADSDTLSVLITSGLCGSDTADISIALDSNYNVGSYTATASVTNNENYVVSDLSKTCDYEIVAKVVDIIWSATTYQYDGQNHRPSAHYLNISSKSVEVAVVGEYKINVGEYSVSTVTIPDGNYTANAETTTCAFTITPAKGSVTWNINSVYYYQDGNEINVSLKAVFECSTPETSLSSDKAADGVSIEIVEGKVINAGTYTAKVTLSNANFTIISGETFVFTVDKKPVAVTFSVNDVERTTDEISESGLTLDQVQQLTASCGIDTVAVTIQFTDETDSVVDAGSLVVGTTYTATAIIDDSNYSTTTSVTFTVTAA
ncbi:MAG: MBG domain-containing protein [Christensenellales bacterium]